MSKTQPNFSAESLGDEGRPRQFRHRVPHAVFDDPRLDLPALYLLLQRARHADNFALNWLHIRKQHGFGKASFYAALHDLTELGYLSREQGRRNDAFGFATEKLDLSAAPVSVRRRFEFLGPNVAGQAWQQQALLDYLLSHAPSHLVTAAMLAMRFEISEKTALRHLKALGKRGLVDLIAEHGERGRFARQGFVAVRNGSPDCDRSDICRKHVHRTDKSRTHNKNDSCNKDQPLNKDRKNPSGKNTECEKPHSAPDCELRWKKGTACQDEGHARCKGPAGNAETRASKPKRATRKPGCSDLYGSSESNDRLIRQMLDHPGIEECFTVLDAYVSDDELKRSLLDRCHGRVGRALLSREGIRAGRS